MFDDLGGGGGIRAESRRSIIGSKLLTSLGDIRCTLLAVVVQMLSGVAGDGKIWNGAVRNLNDGSTLIDIVPRYNSINSLYYI